MTGSVVVREDGAVTEVDVERLDDEESIAIDLDHQPQLVGVPAGMAVEYASPGDGDAATVKPVADGGTITKAHERTRVKHRGLDLEGESRTFAAMATAGLLAASGYMWAHSDVAIAVIAFAAALALGWLVFDRETRGPA